MTKYRNGKTLKEVIIQAVRAGKHSEQEITDYVYSAIGHKPSKTSIRDAKREVYENRVGSSRGANSSSNSNPISNNNGNPQISQSQIAPAEDNSTASNTSPIEGQSFSLESQQAPMQIEAQELSKSYQDANPQTANPDNTPIVDPNAPETQTAENLRVDTGAPVSLSPEGQTLDLTMISSIPAITEEIFFSLPPIQKATDGYKPEQQDLDNITKYAQPLLEKYSGKTVSKYAVEFNFIGATMVPFLKGFGKKIGGMFEKKQQNKPVNPPVEKPKIFGDIKQVGDLKPIPQRIIPPVETVAPVQVPEPTPNAPTPEEIHKAELERINKEVLSTSNE